MRLSLARCTALGALLAIFSTDAGAVAGPDRPGAAPPPVNGGATTGRPRVTEEALPALPTDRGPITTPTFTLTPEQPVAAGRAWLRFYTFRTWARVSSMYTVVSNGGGGNMASVLVMLEPPLRDRAFVVCHVTNFDTAHDAVITTDAKPQRIPPMTARWLATSSVIWQPSLTHGAKVEVDQCQVTGYGTPPSSPPPVSADVAQARLRGARIAKLLNDPRSPGAPPPLPNGPVTSIVLSAQRPTNAGASMDVTVMSLGGAIGTGAEATVFTNENAYTATLITPEGLDASNLTASIGVSVKVTRVASRTASVTCSITNLSDQTATFFGASLPARATRWVDMKPAGPAGDDDEFLLQQSSFVGGIAVNECRVRIQATSPIATSPGVAGNGVTLPPATSGTAPRPPPGPAAPPPIRR